MAGIDAYWTPSNNVEFASAACGLVFLLHLPFRTRKLRRVRIQTAASKSQTLPKAILGVALSVALLVYLVVLLTHPGQLGVAYIASLAISIVAAQFLSLILIFEHRRSTGPSDLGTLYLVASIICDLLLVTIPCGISADIELSAPILTRLVVHLAILVLENQKKPGPPLNGYSRVLSPEEQTGVLSRVFFFWVNPILLLGYRNLLVGIDLPPVHREVAPNVTRKNILRAWDQRLKPETKWTLPRALYQAMKHPFLSAIIPRLFLTVFRYSQPVLIRGSIRYVATSSTSDDRLAGYWIIVAAITVYGGLAISTAVYQDRLNKLKLLTKSALIGLIHHKAMEMPSAFYDNGEAATLMSSDVDGLEGITRMFHETWAQILEVAIGIGLLASELGWFWPLPLLLILFSSRVSRYVAQNLQPRQKKWNEATQARIGATSSMIGSMKSIKMLGLQTSFAGRIQKLRVEELSVASNVRRMMVYYNASANALGIFTPAATLVLFSIALAVKGSSLSAETAFTTMAVLGLITHPANMVMTIIPRAIAAFAGFERIQNYLLRPSLGDQRRSLPSSKSRDQARSSPSSSSEWAEDSVAISLQGLTIGGKQPVLEGPVGCGKSMLLRAILGEVTPSQGFISLTSKRIAYCAQKSWLPGGTIKEVILSDTKEDDEHWYRQVVAACCLEHDFANLPGGDETQVGSRGANLSGGQKQRVTLARAAYARCDIVLLDDTLSALDGETERKVVKNLLGEDGIFRKYRATVVLVSNATQYYSLADDIIILGDAGVRARGNPKTIESEATAIEKYIPKDLAEAEPGSSSALARNFDRLGDQLRATDEAEFDLTRQTGDITLYGYYFHFVGLVNLLLLATLTVVCSVFITIQHSWLQLWTEATASNPVFYMAGFIVISFISWSTTSYMMWVNLFRISPRSGLWLHERLLRIVTCAPLSYFSKTANGSILNRFSQDIRLIDIQLPSALLSVGVQISKLFVQVVVLFVAQKWLVLSFPVCVAIIYVVQRVYLRTSRQLRFLELESRAAVFSSIFETVDGLETIRSFGWRQETVQRNIESVANSQRPESLLMALQRWLNVVLDLLAAAIATGVIAIAVALRGQISGGQVGVALNIMLVANTTLLRLVEFWTDLEVSLGAISRLRTLERNTPPETTSTEDFVPPPSWPSKGEVQLQDVVASYQPGTAVLQNINLRIEAGQKIIICGRTGSGKSSLLLTLLRMLELDSGRIEVDGVDISRVPRACLRERCFVTIAQDPLIMAGETLRYNLDPSLFESDAVLVRALRQAGLGAHFTREAADADSSSILTADMEEPTDDSFLDVEISKLPTLSAGQTQLLALARALVKVKSLQKLGVQPVVLLDEVTSSVDPVTESTMHGVIEEELVNSGLTVIIVAHRLGVLANHASPDKEVIIWMRDGRLQTGS